MCCATGECGMCQADKYEDPPIGVECVPRHGLTMDLRIPAARVNRALQVKRLAEAAGRAEKVMLARALQKRPFEDAIAAGIRMGSLLQAVLRRTSVRLAALEMQP